MSDCSELTGLHAESAAVTHGLVNLYSSVGILRNRRAAGLETHAALLAFLGNGKALALGHKALQQCTGRLYDDDRQVSGRVEDL